MILPLTCHWAIGRWTKANPSRHAIKCSNSQKRTPSRCARKNAGNGVHEDDNGQSPCAVRLRRNPRSEEHTSELQSLMRISYAVFCLKKKKKTKRTIDILIHNSRVKII